jgi:hypothetical protein
MGYLEADKKQVLVLAYKRKDLIAYRKEIADVCMFNTEYRHVMDVNQLRGLPRNSGLIILPGADFLVDFDYILEIAIERDFIINDMRRI